MNHPVYVVKHTEYYVFVFYIIHNIKILLSSAYWLLVYGSNCLVALLLAAMAIGCGCGFSGDNGDVDENPCFKGLGGLALLLILTSFGIVFWVMGNVLNNHHCNCAIYKHY